MAKKHVTQFKRSIPELRTLSKLSGPKRKKFLRTCTDDCISALGDLGFNVLKGNVPISEKKMKKIRRQRKGLVSFVTGKRKRKLASQHGGALGGKSI